MYLCTYIHVRRYLPTFNYSLLNDASRGSIGLSEEPQCVLGGFSLPCSTLSADDDGLTGFQPLHLSESFVG